MRLLMATKLITLLGEGVTEKNVLRAVGVMGKFVEFNVWKHDVQKILPRLDIISELWLYIDTDSSNNAAEFNRFKANIATLKNAKRTVKIFLQVNDLEDELSKACQNNIYTVFGVRNTSKGDLKYQLTHCTNLREKLNEAKIDVKKMWVQSHPKCDAIVAKLRHPTGP